MTQYVLVRFTKPQAKEAAVCLSMYADSVAVDLGENARANLLDRASTAIYRALREQRARPIEPEVQE